MASVSGLLQVRVRKAKGLNAAPAAALTVRLRLLPWKEEQRSDAAQCDDDGTAEWADSDENLVVLPHLAAHDEAQPQLSVDLRSRELLVYERRLGLATIDAAPLLIPGVAEELWVALDDTTSLLLEIKFKTGTTTPTHLARTTSVPARLEEDIRHQHLFRLQSYGAPTWCAVCDRLMLGVRHQGFSCESCGLSCHGGCQLRAHAVHDCVGRQKPPQIQTPQPSFEEEPLVKGSPRAKRSPSGDALMEEEDASGVGSLELHLSSVKLLEKSVEDDGTGDYYVRVVLAGSRDMAPPKRGRFNRRTHTVYQSREPHFDVRWKFSVESFAAEVRVDLVDAARDVVVGSHRFGVLDLLQEQADQRAEDYLAKVTQVIEANLPPGTRVPYLTRSEGAVKYGAPASASYFDDPANSELRDKNGPTACVTWPRARFVVHGDKLWWAPTPISAARPPQPDQFSLDVARAHIRRATDCVHAIYAFMDAYEAFMRWSRPLETGVVFLAFVCLCLFLDAEYAGLVPVTLIALGLLTLGRRRFLGGYPRASFLDEAFEKADAELLNGATRRFRPHGRLKIAVCAGRGFGQDDDVYAVATFRRPLVEEEAPTRKRAGSASPAAVAMAADAFSTDTSLDALLDEASAMPNPPIVGKARADSVMLEGAPLPVEDEELTHHETLLGYTGTCRGRDPRWHGSLGATVDREGTSGWASIRRLSTVLGESDHAPPCVVEPWERRGWRKNDRTQTTDRCLVYPLPQPIDEKNALLPWRDAQGGVRIAVMKAGRMSDVQIGEVVVPLNELVDSTETGAQRERRGWHELKVMDEETVKRKKHSEPPAVHLRLQLSLRAPGAPSASEKATCRAVEAMAPDGHVTEEQTSSLTQSVGAYAREATKPLSTVVTANEYAVYAQNLLGRILDFGESAKNLVTWAHPDKTLFLLGCACFALILFARIKTRYIVLAGGLYEFLYRLLPGDGSPMTTRCINAVRSVPHDRALRDCYAVRAAEHAHLLIEHEKRARRRAQLHAIWSSQHFVEVGAEVHVQDAWQSRHIILHGRRLAAWSSSNDVDAGRAPREVLVLLGHAGLTAPSPTDCRDLDAEAALRVLVVFGQAPSGKPARWAVLCAAHELGAFRAAVGGACATKLE